MSVKIKVSFTEPEELEKILALLKPIVKRCSLSRNKEGRYKKAYIELMQLDILDTIKGVITCCPNME